MTRIEDALCVLEQAKSKTDAMRVDARSHAERNRLMLQSDALAGAISATRTAIEFIAKGPGPSASDRQAMSRPILDLSRFL